MKEHLYYAYIMANRSRQIYVGVTGNLRQRVAQHKAGEVEGFTQRYKTNRLVYFERYQYVHDANARDKELKGWRRDKKVALILKDNPSWADLAEDWSRDYMKFDREVYWAAMKRADDARRSADPSPDEAGFGMTGRKKTAQTDDAATTSVGQHKLLARAKETQS
jgi:putative endonuclease